MKKTAFITGAEGFIGSNLIGFLQAKGWNVIGGYLLHSSAPFAKSGNLRYVHCDLRNGQRVTQLLVEHQPTHIFHLGAQSLPTVSWADPVGTFESNVMGSLRLFERRIRKGASIGHTGQRRAATATVASLWNQQSLPGPIGPRIFSGLQDPDGKHSAVQYHGPRQEK